MRDVPDLPRRIGTAALLLMVVMVIGTLGYMVIEGWNWFDALYMTVSTFTTIGGGEPAPMSIGGKIWTMAVVMIGFGVVTYMLLALFAYAIEGQLGMAVESRRMRRVVAKLTNHFVLCGYGRVGSEIARDFDSEGIPYVVIDVKDESLARAAADGHAVISGNASEIDVLTAAGIARARGLITAVDSDAENIYVTLSARVLRPDIFIVARANRSDSEPKLRLAGANRIISPYTIGGRRMASLAMRPTAVEFVDTLMSSANAELLLEDLTITAEWAGRPLSLLVGDSDETIVLAIKRSGEMIFRPAGSTLLTSGDEIIAAGPAGAIRALENRLTSG